MAQPTGQREGDKAVNRQKAPPLRDPKYLRWLPREGHGRCESCGAQDGTVIAAHVRFGTDGGTGMKPSDYYTVALCARCHADQEANPGPEWWFRNVFLRLLSKRYYKWSLERELMK